MSTGLVMEGGAMRGMFTAGVIDVMMENDIVFDGAVGVSAGAAFGCNIKSRQIGRAIRYNKKYCKNKDYVSLRSWIKTGDLYGVDFGYRRIPYELDPFDVTAYKENPMDFYVVATDMDTGEAVYYNCLNGDDIDLKWIGASASIPIASRPVVIDGRRLSDGGTSDSIPLIFMEGRGYDRNVVILTQPPEYRKTQMKHFKTVKFMLRKYPKLIEALERRPEMYNGEVAYVHNQEKRGKAFVIQPGESLNIGSVCHEPAELERVYQIGRKTMENRLKELKAWMQHDNV